MKVAYFGYNLFSSCLHVLEAHGHDILCIYTEDDSVDADQVIRFAKRKEIPLYFNKPTADKMEELVTKGVQLFFAAEYPWRIPIPKRLVFGVNLHPTMLPQGRGPTPLIWLLLQHKQYSGMTLHKMTDNIDEGDILLQKSLVLDENETYNTLSTKLHLEAPQLLDRFLSNIDEYYANAVPQSVGSYWPVIPRSEQTVDWRHSAADVLRRIRQFGRLGAYAVIEGKSVLITAAEGTVYKHWLDPGTVALSDDQQLVIAVVDGIIIIPNQSLYVMSRTTDVTEL